jgi:hypothetical protein
VTTWILIYWITAVGYSSALATGTADFRDKEACITALQTLQKVSDDRRVNGVCVRKND